MNRFRIKPKAEADLLAGARWICQDNPDAARRFLDHAFATFERIAIFPESGPVARLKHRRLASVRFAVVSPPFNRWLIFYRILDEGVEVLRVVYGIQNWRGNPVSFFA